MSAVLPVVSPWRRAWGAGVRLLARWPATLA
jgi:hypothetical protein